MLAGAAGLQQAVLAGERVLFKGRVGRSEAAIRESLEQRADPRSAATARLELTIP